MTTLFLVVVAIVAVVYGIYQDTKPPRVKFKFEKTVVEAGTRRLVARWSVELEQDIKNMKETQI